MQRTLLVGHSYSEFRSCALLARVNSITHLRSDYAAPFRTFTSFRIEILRVPNTRYSFNLPLGPSDDALRAVACSLACAETH